jgi:hypothetical protein
MFATEVSMSASVKSIKNLPKPFLISLVFTFLSMLGGVALVFFLILPLRSRSATLTTEVEELTRTLNTMKADIKTASEQSKKTTELRIKRDHLLDIGLLKPDHISNSMRMGAKSLMAPLAEQTGFSLESVREHAAVLLRLPAVSIPEQLYARQPVELVGRGSFDQIVRFIQETEETYPLTILSGLVILSQPQTPECHKAVITFEWPVKHEWLQSGPAGQK